MRAADATIVALPRGYARPGVVDGVTMTSTPTSLRCFVREHNGATYNVCAVRKPITERCEPAEADFDQLMMITDPATVSLETVWAPNVELSPPRLCLRGRHMAKKDGSYVGVCGGVSGQLVEVLVSYITSPLVWCGPSFDFSLAGIS